MKLYTIAIGADHRGYDARELLLEQKKINSFACTWVDYGTTSPERTDYPLYAHTVARALQAREVEFGVLLCGTGVGMSMAANRYQGVYAALVWNTEIARRAREEDNANVLVLPTDYLAGQEIIACIDAWLSADFKQGRYGKRIDMIDALAKTI